jgi:hypothetical protein
VKKIVSIIFISALLFLPALSHAQGKIEHPKFMKEYSNYVIDRLNHEAETRAALRKYIEEHKAQISEGYGMHPELMPDIFGIAGAERLNCISGKYYEKFLTELNNEERHTFYETAQEFSWWVVCLAEEEADNMNVRKMNPPISFRQHGDNPFYIKQDLKDELSSYTKVDTSGDKGLSFTGLQCDD